MARDDERPRLFVAIDLPEAVRESLGRLQAELRARDLPGLRWTRPEGIHLTLARVPQPPRPALAERISRALEAVVPPQDRFEATEVVLMRSELQPGGAVYSRVQAFPLS